MLRSIHAECYKVFHRLYFQVSALLCALFAGGMVFCLYLIKTEAGGETIITMPFAVAALLFGMVMGVYLVIIGVDMVFSDQYKFNTLKNEVSFGVGRSRIYLSRWAAALLVMALLYLILVAVYSLGAWLITDVLPVDVTMASPLAGSDLLLCALFGGLISGLGSGLAIRAGGAMDGIEVMAVIFHHGHLRRGVPQLDSAPILHRHLHGRPQNRGLHCGRSGPVQGGVHRHAETGGGLHRPVPGF